MANIGFIRKLKDGQHDSTIYVYMKDANKQGAPLGMLMVDIDELIALDNWFIYATALDRLNFIVKPCKFTHKKSPEIPYIELIHPFSEYDNKPTIVDL